MHHEKIHGIFWYIGRITIIFPLVVVGLALVFKIDQVKKEREIRTRQSISPSVSVSPTGIPVPSLKQSKGVDLTKSQVCTALGSGGDAATIYITKNNIAAEFLRAVKEPSIKVVVKGDCIYTWSSSQKGDQICGIANYMAILNTLSSAGMLDSSLFMEMLNKFSGPNDNLSAFKNVEPVCREQAVADAVFTVDKKINFIKRDLVKPIP